MTMTTTTTTSESRQAVDAAVWGACDILRRSNCASATQYVPELTWILFLRVLDERERVEAENAEAVGASYTESLASPYRWRDWAATPPPLPTKGEADPPEHFNPDGTRIGWKRRELNEGAMNAFFSFVNDELLPYLRSLKEKPDATEKQKIISEIMTGVDRVRVDTEKNFLDVLDRIHKMTHHIDAQHFFVLSQVYEGLLLKMGEKAGERLLDAPLLLRVHIAAAAG